MRLVYEHVLLPGVFIQTPTYLVSIQCNGEELGVFGYDVCEDKELGTAILCRVCELTQCSMVNPALHNCAGIIKSAEGSEDHQVFVYNGEKYTFEKQ